ncbi:hypothetical protein [Paenibacillus xylanexedens]|uniref:hypothetical protein n=1 Tax=Paenibacillus xylanexedens TaxID=528191 RepID=UPI000F534127|nr:hypothetical protein [Paenibacillus xylanexedens]
MNFSEYRRRKQVSLQRREPKPRRPILTSQEERFLYSLRVKTMEHRTLMATLKNALPPSQVDEIIVDYAIRLRKAKQNFEKNNYNYEWEIQDESI